MAAPGMVGGVPAWQGWHGLILDFPSDPNHSLISAAVLEEERLLWESFSLQQQILGPARAEG